ncbi:MAG: hypothetical protein JSS20_05460 [Proteobacteria bacterium]|nr:hypothetical protein [Pseudomonadota bacterium]
MLRVFGLLVIATLSAVSPANAAEPAVATGVASTEAEQLAQRLVDINFARDNADNWRLMLLGQSGEVRCRCKADETDRAGVAQAWRQAVMKSFSREAMVDYVRRELAKELSPAEMRKVVAYYDGPLGRKVHALKKPEPYKAANKENEQAAAQALNRILDAQPARKKAFLDLMSVSGVLDAGVEGQVNMIVGTTAGTFAGLPAGSPRPSFEDIRANAEGRRGQIRASFAPYMLASIARAYRTLSVDEVKAHAAELGRPHQRHFLRVYLKAHNEVVKAHAYAIGAAFARDVHADRI